MTEQLYLNDSYLEDAQATVIACTREGDAYAVELDRTVFYPTGGGQPHDCGTLDGLFVTDVLEKERRVLHIVSAPIALGKTVGCKIDWARRFDHMQQHSGEHLLSFAAKELFGAVNVGFHMAQTHCTIDLDMPLTREQVEQMEARANALVVKNMPVCLKYVEAEALSALKLRKRAEGLVGTARIVYMPGGDSCTCCGTHVAHTGEIGLIAITATEAHKGGVRLSFVCGTRALAFLQKIRDVVGEAARAYSCKAENVPNAARALHSELADVKRENRALRNRLVRAVSRELSEEARDVNGRRLITKLVDLPAAQLRPLAAALCEGGDMLTFLLTCNDEGARYVLSCSEGLGLDMGELAQAVNLTLRARGGGRGTLAQGSAAQPSGLEESIAQLGEYMARRLATLKHPHGR